jgi:mRNA interferase MazF
LHLADAPGNVLVPAADSGLRKDSVANVSQVITIDNALLSERVASLLSRYMRAVTEGLKLVLLS